MSSPLYRAFKERGWKIDMIGYEFCREILDTNPYIDEKFLVRKRWHGFVSALRARKRNYDLVLQVNTSLVTNLMLLVTGTKLRLGYSYK